MRVDKTGDNRLATQIDDFCMRISEEQGFFLRAHRSDATLSDRDTCRLRIDRIEGQYVPINEDEISESGHIFPPGLWAAFPTPFALVSLLLPLSSDLASPWNRRVSGGASAPIRLQ